MQPATGQPITLDKYFFEHMARKLEGASIEKICSYYVQNLIFHNGDYLQYLQAKYNLPNDILKMHTKIVKLAGESQH